ncbi:AAA family ATPase [Myxococcota bacterium]|nr:AAA family ATPase [Myxococcota bacterium]
MNPDKQLWLLVGGNGAGKSTFYEEYLRPEGMRLVNADQIARIIAPNNPEESSYDAAKIAETLRFELLDEGVSFCFETVFSHPSKIDFVAHARALGYKIIIVLIHLDSPELNQARVSQRVAVGGHSVPDQKVKDRIPRMLLHVKQALPLADEAYILDNSLYDTEFKEIATLTDGMLELHANPAPKWALQLLSDYLV